MGNTRRYLFLASLMVLALCNPAKANTDLLDNILDSVDNVIERASNIVDKEISNIKKIAQAKVQSSDKIQKAKVRAQKLKRKAESLKEKAEEIKKRIERAKELMCYQELTLSEIAWELGYSSPAHLSSQFRQVTGMSPREFRELHGSRKAGMRRFIDDL